MMHHRARFVMNWFRNRVQVAAWVLTIGVASLYCIWYIGRIPTDTAVKQIDNPLREARFPVDCSKNLILRATIEEKDQYNLHIQSKKLKTKYASWFRSFLDPAKYNVSPKRLERSEADIYMDFDSIDFKEEHPGSIQGYIFPQNYYSNKFFTGNILTYALEKLDFQSEQILMPTFFFIHPEQCKEFFELEKSKKGKWMKKTNKGTMGMGISLIEDMKAFRKKYGKCEKRLNFHVQYFLHPVFLWDKSKFDLRIYAVIARANPLIVFVDEGYFRVSAFTYDINNLNSLKTNVHVSKKKAGWETQKVRRYVPEFLEYLESQGLSHLWEQTRSQIHEMIRIYFKSKFDYVKDSDKYANRFEWYGLDFMFDADLKPYFVESNRWPGHGDDEHFTSFYQNMFDLVINLHANDLSTVDFESLSEQSGLTAVYNELNEYTAQCSSQ